MSTATTDYHDDETHEVEAAIVTIQFLVWLALAAFSSILSGFVLKQLWGWFIVPLGAAQIGIAHALGLSLLVSALTLSIPRRKPSAKTMIGKMYESLIFHTVGALLAWGFGALYHVFM